MWLSNSSVGRKVVMSVTGIALILFLTFHMAMNLVALVSANGYNMVCEFLGANWYALVATVGLAALFIIHIIYAFWLTMQNRKARGNERYAVVDKPKTVEWASQNMLVLGIVVIVGLGLHLVNFWAKMQLPELMHNMGAHADMLTLAYAANGVYHIQNTFSNPIRSALPHLAGCIVVPPDSRFLELHAVFGLEQQSMDQPLEMYLQHLLHYRCCMLRSGSCRILHQITDVQRRLLINYCK